MRRGPPSSPRYGLDLNGVRERAAGRRLTVRWHDLDRPDRDEVGGGPSYEDVDGPRLDDERAAPVVKPELRDRDRERECCRASGDDVDATRS